MSSRAPAIDPLATSGAVTPHVPTWPAWTAAGLCFLAAGYLATTAGAWARWAQLLEADVNGPALLILRAPHGAPLGLVLVGVTVLGIGLRIQRGSRALKLAAPIAATLLACALTTGHLVLFRQLRAGIDGEAVSRR